jgi:formate dehydrogenase major subunit
MSRAVRVRKLVASWPVLRQLDGDPLGLGKASRSPRQAGLHARTDAAERVVKSVCPYCAVGCGQLVYVRNGKVDQIEGDPDSPISRGRLCPKGAATKSLVQSPLREYRVKYRRPYGRHWEELSREEAMEMIADRVLATREQTWQETAETEKGERAKTRRCMGIAHLGGATLDIEENYLLKKLYTALGIVQVENQARI